MRAWIRIIGLILLISVMFLRLTFLWKSAPGDDHVEVHWEVESAAQKTHLTLELESTHAGAEWNVVSDEGTHHYRVRGTLSAADWKTFLGGLDTVDAWRWEQFMPRDSSTAEAPLYTLRLKSKKRARGAQIRGLPTVAHARVADFMQEELDTLLKGAAEKARS